MPESSMPEPVKPGNPPVSDAPPVLTGPGAPSTLLRAATPWGLWPSLSLSLAAIVGLSIFQGVICVLFLLREGTPIGGHLVLSRLVTGNALTAAILMVAPLLVIFLVQMARFRSPYPIRDHLALRPFSRRDVLVGFGWLLATTSVSIAVDHWWPEPPNATMKLVFQTASVPALLWIAIVLVGPFYEELLFRGFLMEGLLQSRIGKPGAMAASTLAFTAIHTQYGLRELVQILVLGIVLAGLRIRTRSIGPSLLVHAGNNLVACIVYSTLPEGPSAQP